MKVLSDLKRSLEKIINSEGFREFFGIYKYEIVDRVQQTLAQTQAEQQKAPSDIKIKDDYLGKMIEGYHVIKRLGKGGMGTVYQVRKDGKDYAMKVFKLRGIQFDVDSSGNLSSEDTNFRRFVQEYTTLRDLSIESRSKRESVRQYVEQRQAKRKREIENRLKSELSGVNDENKKRQIIKEVTETVRNEIKIEMPPNCGPLFIVGYADSFENYPVINPVTQKPRNELFYVMELLKEGKINPKTISRNEALKAIIEIGLALDYCHKSDKMIVHRDVKPDNIGVGFDRHYRLTDFGILRALTLKSMTQEGLAIGTLHYMSPDMIERANITAQDDVYSLGVVLFELLTHGRKPFEADTPQSLVKKILSDKPPWPSQFVDDVERDLEAITLKAIAKDKSERYRSAEEFAADVIKHQGGKPVTARIKTLDYIMHYAWDVYRDVTLTAGAVTLAGLITLGTWAGFRYFGEANGANRKIEGHLRDIKKTEQSINPEDRRYLARLENLDGELRVAAADAADAAKRYPKDSRFPEIINKIENIGDKVELSLATELQKNISGIDVIDPSFDQIAAKLYEYMVKSKIDYLIRGGEGIKQIKPGEYPNYHIFQQGIPPEWVTQTAIRWNAGMWPAILLKRHQISPSAKTERWFTEWTLPLKDDFSEVFNLEQTVYEALCKGHTIFKDTSFERAALRYADAIIPLSTKERLVSWKDKPEITESVIATRNQLFFWAYERTGDRKYYDAAVNLTKLVDKNFARKDGSTIWKMRTSDFSPYEDELAKSDSTCSFTHMKYLRAVNTYVLKTGDMSMLKRAESYADYYLSHIRDDCSPFMLENKSDAIDAQGSIIAARALQELSKLESHFAAFDRARAEDMRDNSRRYDIASKRILKNLLVNYTRVDPFYQPFLRGGKGNSGDTRDVSFIAADFHLLETLEGIVNKPLFSNKIEVIGGSGTLAGFMERNTGVLSSDKIMGRLTYNKQNINIGILAESSGRSSITINDGKLWDDLNSSFVVIGNKDRTYVFGVNPAGVRYDAVGTNSAENPGWAVVVKKEKGRWSSVYKIPYTELGLDPSQGLNFNMFVVKDGKMYSWNYNRPVDTGDINKDAQALCENPGKLVLR